MILDKAIAVLKKDVLTAVRYRNGFVLGAVGSAAQLATFYYLSRAVGPQFSPEGMPYFLFLLVGTGFFAFLITGMHSFLQTIQAAQQSGTLEVLMTTSTPPAVLLSLSAISAFAGGLVQLVLYVGVGILLFSPALHVSLLGCTSVFIFSVLISIAIGIFAATENLPGGTAYQTDAGMTGPYQSVIGVDKSIILQRFLTQLPVRMQAAQHGAELHSVIVEVDESTGRASAVRRYTVS
jgi:ABC-type transport system involved in cytochrome c biogenesis permease component